MDRKNMLYVHECIQDLAGFSPKQNTFLDGLFAGEHGCSPIATFSELAGIPSNQQHHPLRGTQCHFPQSWPSRKLFRIAALVQRWTIWSLLRSLARSCLGMLVNEEDAKSSGAWSYNSSRSWLLSSLGGSGHELGNGAEYCIPNSCQ